MKEKIRIYFQFGKGGIIIKEETRYASDFGRVGDILTATMKEFKGGDCNLLSMDVEVMKDWETVK